jgi:outer membrane autotransporter protein
MAQNQKSFKNKKNKLKLLLGASALAMSFATSNAMATDYITTGADAAVINNGGGNVRNAAAALAADAPLANVGANYLIIGVQQNLTLTAGTNSNANRVLTINIYGNAVPGVTNLITFGAEETWLKIINDTNNVIKARAQAANGAVAVDAGANLGGRVLTAAGINATHIYGTDVSGIGAINFVNQEGIVTFEQSAAGETVTLNVPVFAVDGAGTHGKLVANTNMILGNNVFLGGAALQIADATRLILPNVVADAKNFKTLEINDNKTVTINADLRNLAVGVNLAGNTSTLIINDGKNILATTTAIKAAAANKGIVKFAGSSNVSVPILGEAATPLARITFSGDNTKTVDMQAGANAIFTASAVFEGNSTFKMSGAATTLTLGDTAANAGKGSITTLTDRTGNIWADGDFAHVIKGNVGAADKKLGDVKVSAVAGDAHGLTIIAAPNVVGATGVVAVTTISGNAAAAASGLTIRSGNADAAGIVDLYVNGFNGNATNISLGGGHAGAAIAQYNLKADQKLVANNFLMGTLAGNQDNKLVLENNSTLQAATINSFDNGHSTIIVGTKDKDIATIITNNIGNAKTLAKIQFSNHAGQTLIVKKVAGAPNPEQDVIIKAPIDFGDNAKANIIELQDSFTISALTNANKSTVKVNGTADDRVIIVSSDGHADAANGNVLGTLDIQKGMAGIVATAQADNYVKNVIIAENAAFGLSSGVANPIFKNMIITSDAKGSIGIVGDVAVTLDKTLVIKNTTPVKDVLTLKAIGFDNTGVNSALTLTKENFGGATALILNDYISTDVNNQGSLVFNNLGALTISSTKDGLTQNGAKQLKSLTLTADDNIRTDLTFSSDYYSKGSLVINKNSSMTLSDSNYSFNNIKAFAVNNAGVLKFNNQDAVTNVTLHAVGGAIVADDILAELNFAGGNVIITSTNAVASLASKKITFSGEIDNSVTLPSQFVLNDVELAVTAKEKGKKHTIIVAGGDHNLTKAAAATSADTNLVFSTNVAATNFTITEKLYAQVTNETAGQANVAIANNAGGVAPSEIVTILGSADKKLNTVHFAVGKDLKMRKSVYAQNGIMIDGQKLTFTNKNTYDKDGKLTQYGNIVDKLPILAGSTAIFAAESGNQGDITFIDNTGKVEFQGNNTYKGNIGTVGNRGNVISTSTIAGSVLTYEGVIFASTLDISKESLVLTGNTKIDVAGSEAKFGKKLDVSTFTLEVNSDHAYSAPTDISLEYGAGSVTYFGTAPKIADSMVTFANLADNVDPTTVIMTFEGVDKVDELKKKFTIQQSANAYVVLTPSIKSENNNTVVRAVRTDNSEVGIKADLVAKNISSDDLATQVKSLSKNPVLTQNIGKLKDDVRYKAVAGLLTDLSSISTNVAEANVFSTNILTDKRLNALGAGDETSNVAFGAWIAPTMSSTTQTLDGLTFGYEMKNYGGTIGFDTKLADNFILGVQFSLGKTTIDLKDFRDGDKSEIQNLSFGVYSSYNLSDDVFAALDFSMGTNEVQSTELDAKAGTQTVKSKYDLSILSGGLKVGYNAKVSDLTFTPTVGISAIGLSHKEYKQTGSTLVNKSFAKDDAYSIKGTLGAKISYDIDAGAGTIVTPDLHGSVQYKFAGKNLENKFTLAGSTDEITPYVAEESKLTAIVGAGLTVKATEQFTFGISGDYIRYNSNLSSMKGTVNLRANF